MSSLLNTCSAFLANGALLLWKFSMMAQSYELLEIETIPNNEEIRIRPGEANSQTEPQRVPRVANYTIPQAKKAQRDALSITPAI